MKLKLSIEKKLTEMELDEEATLEDLRSAVAAEKGVPPVRIRLILKARILTKNEKLKDLNVKDSDIIIVSIKKDEPPKPKQEVSPKKTIESSPGSSTEVSISLTPSEEVFSKPQPSMPSFEKPITPSFDKQPKDDEPFIYAEALYTLMDFGFPENDIKLVLRALKGNLQLASAVLPLTEQMRAFYEKSVQQMELENTGTMGGGDLQLSQHSEPELAGGISSFSTLGLHPMDTSSESDNVVVTLLQNAIQSMNKKAGMDKPKTPEEKLKDIEDIEKMVNDPDQCRRITKLIKWVVVDSSKALKAFPDFIKVAFNKISKRKKAEAILTKEQRACIKQLRKKGYPGEKVQEILTVVDWDVKEATRLLEEDYGKPEVEMLSLVRNLLAQRSALGSGNPVQSSLFGASTNLESGNHQNGFGGSGFGQD